MQLSTARAGRRAWREIASKGMLRRQTHLIASLWCCAVLSARLQEDALPEWSEKQKEDEQRAKGPKGKKKQKKQKQKAEL